MVCQNNSGTRALESSNSFFETRRHRCLRYAHGQGRDLLHDGTKTQGHDWPAAAFLSELANGESGLIQTTRSFRWHIETCGPFRNNLVMNFSHVQSQSRDRKGLLKLHELGAFRRKLLFQFEGLRLQIGSPDRQVGMTISLVRLLRECF